ncbi:uncharacterized protein BO66DRAFT_243929 [Aspergillus aculeatinus CBS 121060]|uniref:Uncharacterized protein n=1 Tax=Aspergillus aculeatinus CBS 121060 TaxID=1448322 RepID=A0ACD1GSW2_9EURO|nr:hypothetical protein BO66DRAFT_243929 [Aspergillus aculeatinus CBS 121060]RAH64293.1 hypothetical protein BO66DRAFT_243929 [Aspergillus aculeatinus CBS 121060]
MSSFGEMRFEFLSYLILASFLSMSIYDRCLLPSAFLEMVHRNRVSLNHLHRRTCDPRHPSGTRAPIIGRRRYIHSAIVQIRSVAAFITGNFVVARDESLLLNQIDCLVGNLGRGLHFTVTRGWLVECNGATVVSTEEAACIPDRQFLHISAE